VDCIVVNKSEFQTRRRQLDLVTI